MCLAVMHDTYALVPKEDRQKLDSKSRKCVILGYGELTRFYDPNEQK